MRNDTHFWADNKIPVCIGTGLVALDVVIGVDPQTPIQFFAGGSCGNVLSILSFLGWDTYPIARLATDSASVVLTDDLKKWGVHLDLISETPDGSTPIIVHRILKDKHGSFRHRFEFRNPEDGKYLPSYKPVLTKSVSTLVANSPKPAVFYFDRMNRASIDLASHYKHEGAIIFFEPPSIKDRKAFEECMSLADIFKFSSERIPDFSDWFPEGQTFLEIETLGASGLRYRSKGAKRWKLVPAYPLDNVADSAGAGDWCSAGLIFKLLDKRVSLKDMSPDQLNNALEFGQALSAINCSFEGARGAMYKIKLEELLSEANHLISKGRISDLIATRRSQRTKIHEPSLSIASLYAHA